MLEQLLSTATLLKIRQERKLVEFIGFEARNKYAIESAEGELLGFAAEEGRGWLGVLFRQILGHWRRFTIHVYGPTQAEEYRLEHPFRFYFERINVNTISGEFLGAVQQRFSIFSKKLDVEDAHGRVILKVSSPIWRIWTFRFMDQGKERAVVAKKWSGLGREMFFDADNFAVNFSDPAMSGKERVLLIAAALFIDLRYFEKKGGGATNIFRLFGD